MGIFPKKGKFAKISQKKEKSDEKKSLIFFSHSLVFLGLVFIINLLSMNRSEEIFFDTGNTEADKYIKVKLENENDTFEILTLKVDTKEAYRDFNADYGVLVGRVTANDGVGIPNAKISIFIPLEEEDEEDGDVVSIYPYKTPRDKNNNGKRYNLLPRVSQIDPDTGEAKPKQPFGSFPIKPEIVTNPNFLKVYKKYYKYTAVTNEFGDYMIFGVPVGTQTVHLSADITDIGKYSMTPAAMVTNLGYSPNLFTDNNSKIKPSNDLDDLPNIETQEISVDVLPFWGDKETFDIGITRQDFRIRATLVNTFVIFGSIYTDGDNSMWGGQDYQRGLEICELYRLLNPQNKNAGILSKRIGNVTEKVYTYPNSVTDEEISDRNNNGGVDFDYNTKMVRLDSAEYSSFKKDGDFVIILNCNRRKIITGENGEEVVVSNDFPGGVFTQFKGFITLEYTEDDIPMDFDAYLNSDDRGRVKPIRHKIKIPQYAPQARSFRKEETSQEIQDTNVWRGQFFTFNSGKLYGITKFHATVANTTTGEGDQDVEDGFLEDDKINSMEKNLYNTPGAIQTNDFGISGNTYYEFPSNALTDSDNREVFVANWMNFSAYLPQVPYLVSNRNRVREMRSNSLISQDFKGGDGDYFMRDNTQPFVAGDINTKWFARSDIHWTDFIEVPPEDINNIINTLGAQKGFKLSELGISLNGNYKNGNSDCPVNGGKINARPTNGTDSETYFYRGFDSSDCLGYLKELGIV
jgi:hypothetical protein